VSGSSTGLLSPLKNDTIFRLVPDDDKSWRHNMVSLMDRDGLRSHNSSGQK